MSFSIKFVFLLIAVGYARSNEMQKIREELLKDYDRTTLPLQDFNKTSLVTFGIDINDINFNTGDEILEVNGYISMTWNDYRLEYQIPDTESKNLPIRFRADEIYIPDVDLYNNVEGGKLKGDPLDLLVISPNGDVLYVFQTKLQIPCVVASLHSWPSDTQLCEAKFGPWTYNAWIVDMKPKDENVDTTTRTKSLDEDFNVTRGGWDILNSTMIREVNYYDCCPEPYVLIALKLFIQRNNQSYEFAIQKPAFALAVVTLLMFLLPPGAYEKVIAGVLCLLANIQFLSYIMARVPISPHDTPLIVEFMSDQIILTVVVVLCSALVARLSRDCNTNGSMDRCHGCFSKMALACCLCDYGNESATHSRVPTEKDDPSLSQGGGYGHSYSSRSSFACMVLAAVIDRACFAIYFVVLVYNCSAYKHVLFP